MASNHSHLALADKELHPPYNDMDTRENYIWAKGIADALRISLLDASKVGQMMTQASHIMQEARRELDQLEFPPRPEDGGNGCSSLGM